MTAVMTGETSAAAQAALVRSGAVSAADLVEASLRAIEARNGAINAFAALCGERALAEARNVSPGDPRPLCGVPVGIKDLFAATEGLPTTHGSAAFGDWIADHDAPHVARLRAAGAIVVGKTNTCELGLRPVTEPERYGPTRNPRDERLASGGSSGGSAAAVAAGFVALCDGSDAGGSIRIPAACCEVVGMKPSAGLVPNPPEIDAAGATSASFGPLATTVGDTALALDVLAGTTGVATNGRFTDAVRQPPARLPVRLALEAPLGVPVDPAPRAAAVRAAGLLAEFGHEVVERAPDWDDDRFPAAWMTAMTAVMQRLLVAYGPPDLDRLEPATRGWLADTAPVSAAARAEALDRLAAYTHRIQRDWPPDGVLLTPTLTRLPIEVAALHARPGVTDDAVRFSAFTRVWNVTGQPALSLPVGTGGTGVQIVGPPGRDDLVLSLAARLEEALR